MRQEALRAYRQFADPRVGVVTSYDPGTHRAKVLIYPEGADPNLKGTAETDWLPIANPMVGSGWGIYAPPTPGEQVFVIHQENNHGAGVIVGRINSDLAPAPSVPSGEMWLVHSSGSFMKFLNDPKGQIEIVQSSGTVIRLSDTGTVQVQHHNGSQLNLLDDGEVQLLGQAGNFLKILKNGTNVMNGDLLIQGSVHSTGISKSDGEVFDFHSSLSALRNHFNSHVHPDPQGGSVGITPQQD